MATRNLTVTLSEETIRLIEAAIASGKFFDPADVIQAALERLCTTEEDFDDWIRREASRRWRNWRPTPRAASQRIRFAQN